MSEGDAATAWAGLGWDGEGRRGLGWAVAATVMSEGDECSGVRWVREMSEGDAAGTAWLGWAGTARDGVGWAGLWR